jgi:SPP1 family predicted phage head-tail adaptor
VRAGRLDRTIAIERMGAAVLDADRVPSSAWTTVATLPAEFVQISADEFLAGGGTASAKVVIFRIRFRDDLEESDRVRFNGRTFGIIGLTEIGRREGLEIRATTKAPDA